MSTNRGPAAAAGNRAAIIKAAIEVFNEQGLDAPLNAIAKRAGVGQGSLYRHFPTRESLAFEAFEGNLGSIEDVVASGGSLGDVLRMVTEQATSSVAFIELTSRHPEAERSQDLARRLTRVVEATIEAGREAGTVPVELSVDDVLLAVTLLASAMRNVPPESRATAASRAWQLMGIRVS